MALPIASVAVFFNAKLVFAESVIVLLAVAASDSFSFKFSVVALPIASVAVFFNAKFEAAELAIVPLAVLASDKVSLIVFFLAAVRSLDAPSRFVNLLELA